MNTYHRIEHRVWGLNGTRARVREYGAEQPNLLDNIDVLVNLHAIADIVGVLDEEEDDGCQDLSQ